MSTGAFIPDDKTADMQREEVQALEAIFDGLLELRSSRRDGDKDFEFPIVYRIKLNEMDMCSADIANCSDGTTNWPKQPLTVEISYQRNYPSDKDEEDPATNVPSFELFHENNVVEFPSFASNKLLAIFRDTAQNEKGMPCVLSCLYAAREFLDSDREWLDDNKDATQKYSVDPSLGVANDNRIANIQKIDTKYACISTHHLLNHKPDNLLKTGHKYKLSGFYKFGTPGVAIAWGETDGIEDFFDSLKRAMPQKKFELVFIRSWDMDNHDGIPKGWNSVDPSSLKTELAKLSVPEEDYYTSLGLEKRDQKKTSSNINITKAKGKRKGKSK